MKPLPLPLRVAAGLAVTAAEQARGLPKHLVGLPVTVMSQVLQFSMRLQQQVTELAIKGDEALSSLRPVEDAPSWATFDEDIQPVTNDVPAHNGVRPASVLPETDEGARDPWEQEERALAEDHTEGEFDSADESDLTAGPDNTPAADAATSQGGDASGVLQPGPAESGAGAGIGGAAGGSGAGTPGGTAPTEDDSAAAGDAGAGPDRGSAAETGAGVIGIGASGTEAGVDGDVAADAAGTGSAALSAAGSAGAAPVGVGNYDELTLPQLRARLRRFSLGELEDLLAYERAHENRPSFVGMLARRIGNVQRLGEDATGIDE